jgi:hypothetical protein
MKAFLITTGSVFGLITLAHIARVIAEGPRLATDPTFVLLTLVAAALCAWAFWLLRALGRRS